MGAFFYPALSSILARKALREREASGLRMAMKCKVSIGAYYTKWSFVARFPSFHLYNEARDVQEFLTETVEAPQQLGPGEFILWLLPVHLQACYRQQCSGRIRLFVRKGINIS